MHDSYVDKSIPLPGKPIVSSMSDRSPYRSWDKASQISAESHAIRKKNQQQNGLNRETGNRSVIQAFERIEARPPINPAAGIRGYHKTHSHTFTGNNEENSLRFNPESTGDNSMSQRVLSAPEL